MLSQNVLRNAVAEEQEEVKAEAKPLDNLETKSSALVEQIGDQNPTPRNRPMTLIHILAEDLSGVVHEVEEAEHEEAEEAGREAEVEVGQVEEVQNDLESRDGWMPAARHSICSYWRHHIDKLLPLLSKAMQVPAAHFSVTSLRSISSWMGGRVNARWLVQVAKLQYLLHRKNIQDGV